MLGAGQKVTKRHNARRWFTALAVGLLPVGAIVGMGCGDDDAPSSALGRPDPGGTWGAQVTLTVVGRGRVTGRGLDCPSKCTTTAVFASNAADGATGGLDLTASPTPGRRFLGWSFEPVTIGTSGRGPDTCNPITRMATVPTVDPSAPTITLPYGEADGISPTGREAQCAAFKRAPLAYKVVANFEGDGPDAGDSGATDLAIYDVTSLGGFTATVLGRTSSGYVYVRYEKGGNAGVAVGLDAELTSSPASLTSVAGSLQTIDKFKVEPSGVVFLDLLGQLSVIRQASPATIVSVGSAAGVGPCRAIAMDSSSNVHCRTSTSIATWKYSLGSYASTPTVTFDDLPSGNELAVDTTRFYFDDGSSKLLSLPLDGTDASAPETVTSSASSVSQLVAGSMRLAFMASSSVNVSSDKLPGATTSTTGISIFDIGTAFAVAFDPIDPLSVYGAGPKGIYYSRSKTSSELRAGGKTYTGMAVGSQYVFYTLSDDDKVYRVTKSGF